MSFKKLDSVVLTKDMPNHGLKKEDVGAIVHVYPEGQMEVEFVTAGGKTQAVVTLESSDVRPITPLDMIAVRQLAQTAA